MTASGSSVGSSSEVNSLVSLAVTENLLGKLEEPDRKSISRNNSRRDDEEEEDLRKEEEQEEEETWSL
jgi:hypothetical protein